VPLAALLAVLVAAPWAAACTAADPLAEAPTGQDEYLSTCARCHQAEGSGFRDVYPPLAGNPIVTLHDPNPTIEVVLEGRGGMPGFRDAADPDELAAIISYIRDAWGNDASPVEEGQIR
jgi:mono/diheme cytochrome c family protein